MEINKIWEWIKANKIASFFIALGFVFLVGFFYPAIIYFQPIQQPVQNLSVSEYSKTGGSGFAPQALSPDSYSFDGYEQFLPFTEPRTRTTTTTELEIREGSMNIDSEDAEREFELLKTFVSQDRGYIENSRKTEGTRYLNIHAQVRIPVENFNSFVKKLENSFEVENFNLTDYRIDIQRQLDELTVIKETLEDFDQMREEVRGMDVDTDKIQVLANITREMRELAREHDRLERDLGGKQRQADMATIDITFVEELDVELDLWPDDLTNRFIDNINNASETVFLTLTSILSNGLVILVKAVEYIIYALIIYLPVKLTWKLVNKSKKKDENPF